MSDEPELSQGQSGEWVVYLEQLLASNLLWDGPQDGTFTAELTEAVVAMQRSAGISPADGVVRGSTWDSLHQLAGGANQGYGTSTAPAPEEPASVGGSGTAAAGLGVPAFRYTLPDVPIAQETAVTAAGTIMMTLTMNGFVQVTFQESVKGLVLNLNDGAWKAQAVAALDGLREGVTVSGFDTGQPSIRSTWGNEYYQTGVQFTPPNVMTFIGQEIVDHTVDTGLGPAAVQGRPGWTLTVTVIPNIPPDPEPVDEPSWFERHEGLLIGVGVVALVGVVTFGVGDLVLAGGAAAGEGAAEFGAGATAGAM